MKLRIMKLLLLLTFIVIVIGLAIAQSDGRDPFDDTDDSSGDEEDSGTGACLESESPGQCEIQEILDKPSLTMG